ncbi:MAG: conjugal transfer protein TraX [Lachnospiraceae bacterium]|nr:conjugal transfer protein TraX [Lachnospiraceae bacterium]
MRYLKKGFISGSTLKIIALVTMITDHLGFGLIYRLLMAYGNVAIPLPDYAKLFTIYRIMRAIGRIAFPIYCFLLTEGFFHTKDRKRYARRLFVFSLISEPFFDLCFAATPLYPGYQNVFFTLLIGLLTIWGINSACLYINDRFLGSNFNLAAALRTAAIIGSSLTGMLVAAILRTDYSYMGVAAIIILYLLRNRRIVQCIAGAAVFAYEIYAPAAFIPILFYNGKRGLKLKLFFYIMYPAHLFLIYLVTRFLGIGSLSPL